MSYSVLFFVILCFFVLFCPVLSSHTLYQSFNVMFYLIFLDPFCPILFSLQFLSSFFQNQPILSYSDQSCPTLLCCPALSCPVLFDISILSCPLKSDCALLYPGLIPTYQSYPTPFDLSVLLCPFLPCPVLPSKSQTKEKGFETFKRRVDILCWENKTEERK